ncbi:proteoglycan 4-like [Amphibalanus amphitrite]|uniref:proteoglycan 4-like n=1 Tax=Amphibalanus amphitrite TaxID=1232801 RepID=UPI001C90713E|nr:proteoglycan 4-like [Amphibalanus amphitrite]XP_043188839.1 proteoglycan 4-like [Amphibalanus amphitrite]
MTSSVLGSSEDGSERQEGDRPRLGDLRSHITCVLCAGYFIDATTIVECLHTFCRSCILRHLEASAYCPICEVKIHRTKGASSLRADSILQTLVYKMVPDLFTQEMQQRRDFYEQRPYADPELPSWAKGDVASYVPHVFTPDEPLQLRLAMFDADRDDEESPKAAGVPGGAPPVRYLRCQAGTPLTVLQKLIRNKYQLPPSIQVQLISGRHVLPDDVTLLDLGYMGYLGQNITNLSFRLVRGRKRPSAPAEPSETLPVKCPRLEASSPDQTALSSASQDARLLDSVTKHQTVSALLSNDITLRGVTCLANSQTETTPANTKIVLPSPLSANKQLLPASSSMPPPTPTDKLPLPATSVPSAPAVTSPVFSSAAVKPSLEHTSSGSLTSVNTSPALSVVVRPEAMFDPDDEDPTSPGVVQDIIASLDAEEEGPSVARTEVVACQNGGSRSGAAGAQSSTEEAARRKPDKEAEKRAVEEGKKNTTKVQNGETNISNGKPQETIKEDDLPRKRNDEVQIQTCSKHQVPNKESTKTVGNSTATPVKSKLTERAPVTSESNVLNKNNVSKPPDQPSVPCNGHATSKSSVGGLIPSPSGTMSFSVPRYPFNGEVSGRTQCHSGVDERRCDTSNGGLEKELNARPSLNTPRANSSTPQSPTIPTPSVIGSGQAPSLLNGAGQKVPSKHIHSGAQLQAATKISTTSTVKELLLKPSTKPSEASDKGMRKEAGPASTGRMANLPYSLKLHIPSPPLQSNTMSYRMLDVPKVQHTIHNITNPSLTQLPNPSHHRGHAMTEQRNRTLNAHVAETKPSATLKRSREEPAVQSKRAKVSQDAAGGTTPLDLSNPSKKTVAADSTSMLYGSPVASPKSSVPKMKAGKSQDIHSIVDSLANREHISLTAISSNASGQTQTPAKHSSEAKTCATTTKPIPSYPKAANIPRKVAPQSGRRHPGNVTKPPYPSTPQVSVPSPMSPHRPLPMSLPMPESASCYFPPGGLCSPPLHVDTSLASRLSYDMAMRNLLTFSHMAMAQGGMVRPPSHMFPTHPMFPPLPKGHEFHPMSDPSLLRRQSEARMGASAKKASPTAGTTAPPLRTPTALTSASIQHMEDLTRTVGKRKDPERHSVTLTPIPFKG